MSIDDYITDFIKQTIERKKREGISPCCCTQSEILRHLSDVVLKIMRTMHEDKIYKGAINKDKIPMLIEIENGRNNERNGRNGQ